ncbi:hypothetical protein DSM106972_097530 [Dulcicalothrix desertica PCC 7102]|uniref:Uncharacterized protein n=1 Tax=Dulcicalothrix desertica PCC 7102 TaxID=232991 RepID=A0A433UH16_9CYAN|nr:hypothetical protein [Dulcicalothrix desertica]RUS93121.1 hypothetical protein DSM106972_097530 [Dulcicalothrix desertica PCC 7102]TWH61198.1 hypothetical protein CAL7102_01053 [Dulcicalothrix desertica PCC 7102]
MNKNRVQLNVKLDSEESQALVDQLRQEALAKGWTLRDALLDAVKQWLANPPAPPPTPEGMLPEILNRLEALEANEPDITAITNAVLEQLPESISTHMGRQDVDYLLKRVNDLQQFTRQELAARDKRLDAIRDALSIIQAKISELQDGQATLATAIASDINESKDTQPVTQLVTQISTQVDTPAYSQAKKVSKKTNTKTSKGQNTHKSTHKTTQKEKDVLASSLKAIQSRESLTCRHCGAIASHKRHGTRKNKSTGEVIQRYQCIECGKTFYDEPYAASRRQPNEPLTYEEIKDATDEEVRRMSVADQWQAVCDDPSEYPDWQETTKNILDGVRWNERNK